MTNPTTTHLSKTLNLLHADSRYDHYRMLKGAAKSIFGAFEPKNFKDAYLAISKEQGEDLVELIKEKNLKNIVEFGTSFGISTLYLAQGILSTGGKVLTTELIPSKAAKATENLKSAGVSVHVEVRVGNAMETLKDHSEPIDLLLLDGWKDLYLPLFRLLEPNFHDNTIVYVDNADMGGTQQFLKAVRQNNKYSFTELYNGKAVLINLA